MRRERLMVVVLVAVAVLACWSTGLASANTDAQTGNATSCAVVERSEWEARPPVIAPLNMTIPVPYVVIHHSYIPAACSTREACIKAMKAMQDMHQIRNKWNDIGYNFAIGSDGEVYEGRGWDVVGAHAPKYNFMSVGICFIGDYRTEVPSAPMLAAAQRLIRCGIARGSVSANYTLVGHRQVRDTECPGGALFQEIQHWLHWKPIRDIQPRVTTTSSPPSSSAQPGGTTTLINSTAGKTSADNPLRTSGDNSADTPHRPTTNNSVEPAAPAGDNNTLSEDTPADDPPSNTTTRSDAPTPIYNETQNTLPDTDTTRPHKNLDNVGDETGANQ